MKTFIEFLNEDAVKAQQAWQDWMKQNPQEFSKGGRFYERGSSAKTTAAAKEFMKGYMKTGKPPAGFEVKSTKVPGQDIRSGSQARTQTPPPGPQRTQTPPPGGGAKPPSTSSTPVSSPRSSARPGFRSRFSGSEPALSGAINFATRKAKGQSTTRAATGAVASGLGWMKGAELGAKAGSRFGPKGVVAGGLLGGTLGQSVASSAVDAIPQVGPSEKDLEKTTQRYGMRKARQGMAASNVYGSRKGSAITGVGGPLTVDKKAGTITSGGKKATLGKTQLVRDPKTGKQVVGDLAYRNGKPVYIARPSTASRDSNASVGSAWRNVQRSLNIGGQRERDVAAAKQEYRTALKNTQTYQKQLGIKPQSATAQRLPGQGVGPKKVGPKKVGPKIVGPKIVGPKKPTTSTPGSTLVKPV